MSDLDDKLERLRQRWANEPENRPIIEKQAKLLKIAKEIRAEKYSGEQEKFI